MPGIHDSSHRADTIPLKGGLGFHHRWAEPTGALGARIHAPVPASGGQFPSRCTKLRQGFHTSCDQPRPPYHRTAIGVPPRLLLAGGGTRVAITMGRPYPPQGRTWVCPVLGGGRKSPGIHYFSSWANPIPLKEGVRYHRR